MNQIECRRDEAILKDDVKSCATFICLFVARVVFYIKPRSSGIAHFAWIAGVPRLRAIFAGMRLTEITPRVPCIRYCNV